MKKGATITSTLTLVAMLSLVISVPASAQTWPEYAGTNRCYTCHAAYKADFEKSGHPWKIQRIDQAKIGTDGVYRPFPTGTNTVGVPLSPEAIAAGYTYKDSIGFLIGGYGWKARWMAKDGRIYEGAKAQYNLGTTAPSLVGHGAYNSSNVGGINFGLRTTGSAQYNCGACHATGWKAYDAAASPYRFENLPGFDGTFLEFGVQCEGCHGPSLMHANNPSIKPPKDGFDGCKSCHARGTGTRIPVKSDKQFLDHREQYDQMFFSVHRRKGSLTCTTCHNPHKSTIYDLGGLKDVAKTCLPCHQNKEIKIIVNGVQIQHGECKTCHMPYIGNSAVKQNNNRGDQASHMWKINTQAVDKFAGMWTTDSLNVKIPADSIVAHTLDFACLGCHTTKNLEWASTNATGIHSKTITITSIANEGALPSAYFISQNYPNPFNPSTSIKFGLPENDNVKIDVFSALGEYVTTIAEGNFSAGYHTVNWNAESNKGAHLTSGIYIYRIETSKFIESKKMILIR